MSTKIYPFTPVKLTPTPLPDLSLLKKIRRAFARMFAHKDGDNHGQRPESKDAQPRR
jgi:hypothetical protein